MNDNEFNFTWRPVVDKSTKLLEASAELEPNASYTIMALGIQYTFLYEYEKANKAFEKFLELRPYELYAKYSLGLVYSKMKQYDKAQKIFEELATKYPQYSDFRIQLADILMNTDKDVEFMKLTDKIWMNRPTN